MCLSLLSAERLGWGKPPVGRDGDRYEYFYAHVDMVIVGGGVAGLTAALAAGESGARVLLMEQTAHFGGRLLVDDMMIDGKPAKKMGAGCFGSVKNHAECDDS